MNAGPVYSLNLTKACTEPVSVGENWFIDKTFSHEKLKIYSTWLRWCNLKLGNEFSLPFKKKDMCPVAVNGWKFRLFLLFSVWLIQLKCVYFYGKYDVVQAWEKQSQNLSILPSNVRDKQGFLCQILMSVWIRVSVFAWPWAMVGDVRSYHPVWVCIARVLLVTAVMEFVSVNKVFLKEIRMELDVQVNFVL